MEFLASSWLAVCSSFIIFLSLSPIEFIYSLILSSFSCVFAFIIVTKASSNWLMLSHTILVLLKWFFFYISIYLSLLLQKITWSMILYFNSSSYMITLIRPGSSSRMLPEEIRIILLAYNRSLMASHAGLISLKHSIYANPYDCSSLT